MAYCRSLPILVSLQNILFGGDPINRFKLVNGCDPNKTFRDNVLANRSATAAEADITLKDLSAPFLMKDAEKAASVIREVMNENGKILLYSDYDCDGWGCCVIFDNAMKMLGYDNYVLHSNKRSQGYGMKTEVLEEILTNHPDIRLVVTADNGITCLTEAAFLKSQGIRLVVTDHHLPVSSGALPEAEAVVDPHQNGETCPYREFCGTGVLFKVLWLLLKTSGKTARDLSTLLDVVALATVADVVAITGENRAIVKAGLVLINGKARPQWEEFIRLKPGNSKEIRSSDLGFYIGPCINAVSRMSGDIQPAVRVFTDPQHCDISIEQMLSINQSRKDEQREMSQKAFDMLGGNPADHFICQRMAQCGEGVIGLVAGQIQTKYYRPTIVFTLVSWKSWKGSARSIPGVHMKNMLDDINAKHPGVITTYGGHEQAAGLTIPRTAFDEFRQAAEDYCTKLDESVFTEPVVYDWELKNLNELPALLQEQLSLEPYGHCFPEPLIHFAFKPSAARTFKDDTHLELHSGPAKVLCWNIGDLLAGHEATDIAWVDCVCTLAGPFELYAAPEYLSITFADGSSTDGE